MCVCVMSMYPACSQVFGLGNKTYEHYNIIGRYVDKRLEQLGAERICELGEGDDDSKLVTAYISVGQYTGLYCISWYYI